MDTNTRDFDEVNDIYVEYFVFSSVFTMSEENTAFHVYPETYSQSTLQYISEPVLFHFYLSEELNQYFSFYQSTF